MAFTKSTTTAIFYAAVLLSSDVIQPTNAIFFDFLFNTVFSSLIQEGCELVQTELGIASAFDCDCGLSYAGLFQGFDGSIICNTTENVCLNPPDDFCGSVDLDVGAKAGLFLETQLSSDLNACFTIESGFPFGVESIDSICFTFTTADLGFDTCKVQIGNVPCDACDICGDKTSFTFDCSNVDLLKPEGDAFTIDGPKIETCLSLVGSFPAR